MILDRLKRAGMTVVMSPQTMKLLSNPNVQKAMMRAINLRADLRETVQKNVSTWARNMNLVTSDEVLSLKRTIRELESTLERMRRELKTAPVEPSPQTAQAEAPTAKKKVVTKKKVVAKKKIIAKKKTSST